MEQKTEKTSKSFKVQCEVNVDKRDQKLINLINLHSGLIIHLKILHN